MNDYGLTTVIVKYHHCLYCETTGLYEEGRDFICNDCQIVYDDDSTMILQLRVFG